jgi:predicted SAM-dependent methyltransferase
MIKKEKLIIGSAGKKDQDAVTLDIDPKHDPDIVHDLNKVPFPFEDNQFRQVICHHVLEHLDDLGAAMGELHRICRDNGFIYIEVPHHTSWQANTPDHKLRFNYFALDQYIEGKSTWKTGKKFRIIKSRITFHKFFRFFLLHKLFNAYPELYEKFLAYRFPAEHLKFWLQPVKN